MTLYKLWTVIRKGGGGLYACASYGMFFLPAPSSLVSSVSGHTLLRRGFTLLSLLLLSVMWCPSVVQTGDEHRQLSSRHRWIDIWMWSAEWLDPVFACWHHTECDDGRAWPIVLSIYLRFYSIRSPRERLRHTHRNAHYQTCSST